MTNSQISKDTGQVYSAPETGPAIPTSTIDAVNAQTSLGVTDQIRRYHELYGSSDSTDQRSLAASKSLNYAKGATKQRATRVKVGSIVHTLHFIGQIGLFGAENAYARVQLDIDHAVGGGAGVDTDGYEPATISWVNYPTVNTYEQAMIYPELDPITLNTYEPATITDSILPMFNPKVSVRADNLKTGNIYMDDWLEVQLYTKQGEMWPYDTMYLNPRDYFFIGFHARDTRRLDYNVDCIVGEQYLPASEIKEAELIVYTN